MSRPTDRSDEPPDEPPSSSSPDPSPSSLTNPAARSRTPETRPPSAEVTQGPNSTPVANRASTHRHDSKSKNYRSTLEAEMSPLFHQAEYSDFMENFVTVGALGPGATGDVDMSQLDAETKFSDLTEELLKGKDETALYAPICKSLNNVIAKAPCHDSKQYVFKDVSYWPESRHVDHKVDIAMYPKSDDASRAYTLDEPPSGRNDVARNAWAWMVLAIEVKHSKKHTAFTFDETPSNNFLSTSVHGRDSQAQFALYATEIMLRQHRTHVFMVYIHRNMARLTRWDRTGCIVTTPFNFKDNPEMLLNFVYRIVQMSDAERGYDITAKLATADEIAMLKAFKPKNRYAKDCVKGILDAQLYYPIYKITCPAVGADEGSHKTYFVGKHVAASYSPTGRATRGYIAFAQAALSALVSASISRLSFMKDYWRPEHPIVGAISTELDIYKTLARAKVSHVPTIIAGGDIPGQFTITQKYLKRKGLPKRQHCRLVVAELARALDDGYENSSVLIVLLYHGLLAHKGAWEAGILHRDISVNNIMRVVDQEAEDDSVIKGILSDWDLAKYEHQRSNEATQDCRSGTWAYMSAVLLQYPLKPNELADDLESFVHVLTFLSLRFHPHTLTTHPNNNLSPEVLPRLNEANANLASHVWKYYYFNGQDGGLCTGGTSKMDDNMVGRSPWRISKVPELNYVSSTLVTLIDELFELIKQHYNSINFESLSRYGPPPPERKKPDIRTVTLTVEDEDEDEDEDDEESFLPVPVPAPKNGPAPPARDLRSHDHILKLFGKAFRLVRASASKNGVINDATKDQFHGLIQYTGERPTKVKRTHALSTGASTQASSGSKRFKPNGTSHGTSHGLGLVPEGGEEST